MITFDMSVEHGPRYNRDIVVKTFTDKPTAAELSNDFTNHLQQLERIAEQNGWPIPYFIGIHRNTE